MLELFAGSCSVGKAAHELGFEVFSSDVRTFEKLNKGNQKTEPIHYVADILNFDPSKVPFKPDIIWASPPCTAFSVASCWLHWNIDDKDPKKRNPATKKALHGIKMVKKTLELIQHFKPQYWFIENPRGMLRTRPFMIDTIKKMGGVRHTVTYCQYGDTRMKPTDVWTNSPHWVPRPMCKRGMPCHEAAKRGTNKGGVMRQSNSYERSKIPHELCIEVLASCDGKSKNKGGKRTA